MTAARKVAHADELADHAKLVSRIFFGESRTTVHVGGSGAFGDSGVEMVCMECDGEGASADGRKCPVCTTNVALTEVLARLHRDCREAIKSLRELPDTEENERRREMYLGDLFWARRDMHCVARAVKAGVR